MLTHRQAIYMECTKYLTSAYRNRWFGADSMFDTEYESGWLTNHHFITSSTFIPSDPDQPPIKKYQLRQLVTTKRIIKTKLGFDTYEAAAEYMRTNLWN